MPSLVLIGDSHLGKIASALEAAAVPYAGGGIMWTAQWHNLDFDLAENEYFMPRHPEARKRWREIYAQTFGRIRPSLRSEVTVITNIGAHSSMAYYGLVAQFGKAGQPAAVSVDDIKRYLLACRAPHIALIKRLINAGYRVVFVSDPPSQIMSQDVFAVIDDLLTEAMAAERCQVFHARRWINEMGGFPESFRSTEVNSQTGQLDWIHGSDLYYASLADMLLRTFGGADRRGADR